MSGTKARKQKEGLALLERSLKLLGWTFAIVDVGQDPKEPVDGMIIGTRDYIESLSSETTEVAI